MHDAELTVQGRRSRRSERSLEEYGIRFDELALLVATIARYRHGLTTTRGDVLEFIQYEDGLATTPGFDRLRRMGLVKQVGQVANKGTWVPTLLAIKKFEWAGRESTGRSAAE